MKKFEKNLLLRYHLGEENQMENPKKQIDWKKLELRGTMRFLTIKGLKKLESYRSLLAYTEKAASAGTWAKDYVDDDDDVVCCYMNKRTERW